MDFKDLCPNDVESYRLAFLLDETFDELHDVANELSNEAKASFLFKLSSLVVEFSPLFFGGNL